MVNNTPGNTSAASWGAIFAGAMCAAGLSFILIMLGFGLGFSALAPWTTEGGDIGAIGFWTVIWLILIQILSSGLGGYLTGRLRVQWTDANTDEIFFRDTANGLTTWALATIASVVLLTASVVNVVGAGARAGAEVAGETADLIGDVGGMVDPDYFTNVLFRTGPDEERAAEEIRDEISAILMRSLREDGLDEEDAQYAVQVIAEHTGLSQQEAQQRLNQTVEQAQQAWDAAQEAIDEARQATSRAALWMFVALLAGAFFAALMATFGGKQRDALG